MQSSKYKADAPVNYTERLRILDVLVAAHESALSAVSLRASVETDFQHLRSRTI